MWGNEGFGSPTMGGGAGAGGFASPTQVVQEKRKLKSQNVIAVSARQVVQDSDKQAGILRLGDTDAGIVVLVGIIKSVEEKATCITYRVDDGTDCVEVKHFVESGGDPGANAVLQENTYCRVHGHIRTFDDKINIVTLNIRPVADENEVTLHMLEVERNKLYFSKHNKILNNIQQAMDTSMNSMPSNMAQGDQRQSHMPGLNGIQQKVYDMIRHFPEELGMSVQQVQQRCGGMSEAMIRSAIDFLSTEGHVYSTIDDDHYKSTDG